eukprot:COSAG02_NODE_49794_length_324_cov_1.368889_1_plen_69_part_01
MVLAIRAVRVKSPGLAQRNGLALVAAVHHVSCCAPAVKDGGGVVSNTAFDYREGGALRWSSGQRQEVVY